MFQKLICASAVTAAVFSVSPAMALSNVKAGVLSCDVSAGIGMIVAQKQTMRCSFTPVGGGAASEYTGRIDQYGVAIGEVAAGSLVWAVFGPEAGAPLAPLRELMPEWGQRRPPALVWAPMFSSAELAGPFRCSRSRWRASRGSTSRRA